jgi:tRNA (adenine57-N1/adenine58-N1)-methyltransferase
MEILFRMYKTVAARVRPEDRMIGHTGYLLFCRKIEMVRGITSGTGDTPSE